MVLLLNLLLKFSVQVGAYLLDYRVVIMAHFVFVRSLGFGSSIIGIAVIKKLFILNVVIVALI